MENLPKAQGYTFPEFLSSLHEQGFTGMVTLHFHNGIPKTADIGRPMQITFHLDNDPP